MIWFLLLMPFIYSALFFFNDTATTEIYTLSLHDALPISLCRPIAIGSSRRCRISPRTPCGTPRPDRRFVSRRGSRLWTTRSEEHTSELQSLAYLVCRLLLEKKKKTNNIRSIYTFENDSTD